MGSLAIGSYLFHFHSLISIAIMFSAAVWLSILSVASASHPPHPTAAPQYSGHSQNSWINYTAVPGFFLQDDAATTPSTFDYFEKYVDSLNKNASHNVNYKVLFMGRHGEGYHNAAETFYGTPACYYSILDGNATVTWADAHLDPAGISQAQKAAAYWASRLTLQKIPAPQSYYTSPLYRCLQTSNITFSTLSLPKSRPFKPTIKELFREGISGHTCDRRSNKTFIHESFPTYKFEKGFVETDPLWEALHGETSGDQDIRSKKVLDEVFGSDDNTWLSITSHSGEIASILRVLHHRVFSLTTGAIIPVLVKAETIRSTPTSTSYLPCLKSDKCTFKANNWKVDDYFNMHESASKHGDFLIDRCEVMKDNIQIIER
ncbi:phosphoglycerate mutase protein [Rutstroemia sp. NJR-2017a BVV2]|nr:phosphoglycerate mutase protein [Rutstroemia sp. NJR-2017a BVV2]